MANRVFDDLGIGAKSRAKAVRNPVEVGISAPASVVPMGATRNGEVYLFAENLADELSVFMTVFDVSFPLRTV